MAQNQMQNNNLKLVFAGCFEKGRLMRWSGHCYLSSSLFVYSHILMIKILHLCLKYVPITLRKFSDSLFSVWVMGSYFVKFVHFKKTVAQSSFLLKVLSILLKSKQSQRNDNTFERNEDCTTVFLKWADFRRCKINWSTTPLRNELLCQLYYVFKLATLVKNDGIVKLYLKH